MKKAVRIIMFLILLSIIFTVFVSCKKDSSFTVTYYDGDELIDTRTTKYKAENIDAPQKTGYTFSGWCSDKEGNKPFDFDSMVTADTVLYAKYEQIIYELTFKLEGNQDIKKNIAYGQKLSDIPSAPAITGKTFDGWYSDSSYGSKYDFDKPVTSSKTLYGKYSTVMYTLTFKVAGSADIIKTVAHGTALTDIPAVPPVTGMVGVWRRNGADVTPEFFESIISDATFTAVYSIAVYTVSFVCDYLDIYDVQEFEVEYGGNFDIRLTGQPLSCEGHTAVWESKNLNNIRSDITVNAVYSKNKYTVYFINGDGTSSVLNNVEYGTVLDSGLIPDIINPPEVAAAPDRYENIRWVNNYSREINSPITSGVTFSVVYDVVAYITMNLNLQGAEFGSDMPFIDGTPVKFYAGDRFPYRIDITAPAGYKLVGWTDESGNPAVVENLTVAGDAAFTAEWKIILCSVSFPSIDGIVFNHSYIQPMLYGETLTFSITSPGIEIISVAANGGYYTADQGVYSIILTDDVQIAVRTAQLLIYTLRFYDEGGKLLATRSVTHNQPLLAVPVHEPKDILYEKIVWLYEDSPFDFSVENIVRNMDFTVDYIYTNYACIYVVDGILTDVSQVKYNDAGFMFKSPTGLSNGLFGGWYYDDDYTMPASESEIILMGKSVTVYAKIIPYENYTGNIIGVWVSDEAIMEFFANGLLKIYRSAIYLEISYKLNGTTVTIGGVEFIMNGNSAEYLGESFVKRADAFIVYFDGLWGGAAYPGHLTLPAGFTWYYEGTVIKVDETDLDLSMITADRQLRLYGVYGRAVTVIFNPEGGVTEGNLAYITVTVYDDSRGDIGVRAELAGKEFRGWVLADGFTAADMAFLRNYTGSSLEVYASYYDSSFQQSQALAGRFFAKETADEIIFIIFVENGEGYFFRTFNKAALTFADSAIFYYTEGGSGYLDEGGNEITLSGGGITVFVKGSAVFFENYAPVPPAETAYFDTDGSGNIQYIFFDYDGNSGIVSYLGNVCQYIVIGGKYYTLDFNLNLVEIDLVAFSVISAATQLPVEFLGDYDADIMGAGAVITLNASGEFIMQLPGAEPIVMQLYKITEDIYILGLTNSECTLTPEGNLCIGEFIFTRI